MGLRINTNVQSLSAQKELSDTVDKFNHVQKKLASGQRITQALDDAAGLAISENLRATMRSTAQNVKNAQNGMFLLETAEGALNEITDIVIRMKELAIQASSDTNGDKERGYLDNEYQALKAELDRISEVTLFNGRPLLNGEGGEIDIQVGPNNDPMYDRIGVNVSHEITLSGLELDGLSIDNAENSRESIDPINFALERIASVRGAIGASEARLNSSIKNLQEFEINVSSAFSKIRDADLAFETAEFAKYDILNQAGTAVLTQANNAPRLALKLLG